MCNSHWITAKGVSIVQPNKPHAVIAENTMRRICESLEKSVSVASLILISCGALAAQPSAAVIEQLQRQYVPTILFDPASNTSTVSVEGTVLTLRQGGVKAN